MAGAAAVVSPRSTAPASAEESQFALGDLTDVDTTGQVSGDQLLYNGTGWGPGAVPEIVAGDGISIATLGGTSTISTLVPPAALTIVSFSESGSWAVPATATWALFQVWGAGGGGGSGRVGAAGSTRGGGGGGAAGSFVERTQGLAKVRGTSIPITIGAGGAGGAAATASDTNGNDGLPGGETRVGGTGFYNYLMAASGGGGGKGGTTSAGAGGWIGPWATLPGTPGQEGGAEEDSPTAGWEALLLGFFLRTDLPVEPESLLGMVRRAPAGCGGGGGGLKANNGTSLPSAGMQAFDAVSRYRYGAAGTSTALNGGSYAEHATGQQPMGYTFGGGVGGGGGFASTSATAGSGGTGSPRGGGGGGGAAAQNGSSSGAGGAGGNGFVRIIVF